MELVSPHALAMAQQRQADLQAEAAQIRLLRQAYAGQAQAAQAVKRFNLSFRQRLVLSAVLAFCMAFVFARATFAQNVLTDDNGISGFELYTNGLYWWSASGNCTGEFKHTSTIRVRGTLNATTKSLAADCALLDAATDNAVRDDAYVYFFNKGQLQRKALSAAEADPSEPLTLAAPVLNGEAGVPLLLVEGNLYWANLNGGSISLQQMPADGTVPPQTLTTLSSLPRKWSWRRYQQGNGDIVTALVWVAVDGNLYRYKLNQPNLPTLLASGIIDFAIHAKFNTLAGTSETSVYAAQGTAIHSPNMPTSRVLKINLESNLKSTVYTAVGNDQVTAVTTDSDSSAIVPVGQPAKNIYLTEVEVDCGDLLCATGNSRIKRHAMPADDANWQLIVASEVSGNLRSNDQWLYYLRRNLVDGRATLIARIATDAPALELDLQADRVEIVQAIQSLSMDVPLITNKPTFARGYAHLAKNTTGNTTWFPAVMLRGFLNGVELPGSPIGATNLVGIDTSNDLLVKRSTVAGSYLFRLPDGWLANGGALEVRMIVDPNQDLPETATLANNVTSTTANLIAKNNTCIDTVRIHTANTIATHPQAMPEIVERARSLLPVPNLEIYPSDTVISKPVFKVEVQCYPIFGIPPVACVPVPYFDFEPYDMSQDQDAAMTWLTVYDTLSADFNSCDDSHLLGMVDPSSVPFNGLGMTWFSNDLLVRMEPSAGDAPSFNSPYGGRTLAHELGHNYGRQHIDQSSSPLNCGDSTPDDPDGSYPFDPCTLGPTNDGAAWFGFDSVTGQVITPGMAGDLMSYAPARWTSAYTWLVLASEAGTQVMHSAAADAASSPQFAAAIDQTLLAEPMLLVSGLISVSQNTAHFETLYQLPSGVVPTATVSTSLNAAAQATGDYRIRLLDGSGATLSESTLVLAHHAGEGSLRQPFVQLVPLPAQTKRVLLVHGETTLAARSFSSHAPSLSLIQPVVDEASHTLWLQWMSSDADNTLAGGFTDILSFVVQYSPDNGTTWQTILVQYPWLAATVDTRHLPGGTQALVRVLANDGANTTVATSAPFALNKHVPTVQIGGVTEGERIAFGESITLLGLASDAEDGSLHGASLTWTLSNTASLDNMSGNQLVRDDLSPGDYVATLSATDSDGQRSTATRHFTVLPLLVPDASKPNLDGFCADAGYKAATPIQLLTNGQPTQIWLLHAGGKLYLCFSDLQLAGAGKALTTVGLYVDVNNSGGDSLQPDDLAFLVDEDGIPYQRIGAHDKMVANNSPKAGFATVVEKSTNGWSAEMEIAETLVGGWNHAARLYFNQRALVGTGQVGFLWPQIGRDAFPNTWAAAFFGPLPTAENRAPLADAGESQWVNVAVTKTVMLDGRNSFDPDETPLIYSWSQVAGPSVTLQNAASATPTFVATPLTSAVTLRFQLLVNDGTASSAGSETTVTLLPTARPHTPATFTPADGQAVAAAKVYLPLVAR